MFVISVKDVCKKKLACALTKKLCYKLSSQKIEMKRIVLTLIAISFIAV